MMEEEEEEARGARCRWPLVVTEAGRTIEDDTWQARKAARKAKIRRRGGTGARKHTVQNSFGGFSLHT